MSAPRVLRLALRPLRGAAILDPLAVSAAAVPKQLPHRLPACLEVHSAVAAVGLNSRRHRGAGSRARFFSTAPPPPRQPRPDDRNSAPESEPTVLGDAASTTPSPLEQPGQSTQPSQPANTQPAEPQPPPRPDLEADLEPDPAPSATQSPPPESPPEPPSSSQSSSTAPPLTPPKDDTNGNDDSSNNSNKNADPSLPSFTETHRHPLSARFSTFMDNLQSRAVTATQTINDLTGYSAIEAIKARNTQLEGDLAAAQRRLRAARHDYKARTAHRAATQREVTALLARKDTWTPADLERFTALYRTDHEVEAQVAAAAAELTDAEADDARLGAALNQGILRRYHEEQIWSDRIRRQSTWGTWGLMGVNVVLFLVLQFVAEPWRRKRLMRGIEERERGVMDEVKRELQEVRAALEATGLRERERERERDREDPVAISMADEEATESFVVDSQHGADTNPGTFTTAVPEPFRNEHAPPRPWREVLLEYWEDPELLREAVLDLSSDRMIGLRMRDASLIALQGAAAGATVAAVLAVAAFRSCNT